jgi:hypothetical protein
MGIRRFYKSPEVFGAIPLTFPMNILDTSAAFPYIHFFEQQVRGFAPIGILASGS